MAVTCRPVRWVQLHVPIMPVVAVAMFIPGIILWAVFTTRCKHYTVQFFSIVASVSPDAIDVASSAVSTTVIAVVCLSVLVLGAALALATVRKLQQLGRHPDCWCPMGTWSVCGGVCRVWGVASVDEFTACMASCASRCHAAGVYVVCLNACR